MERSPRVLYVDSDADAAKKGGDVLESEHDLRVVHESTAEDALDRLDETAIDCLVSAYHLDGTDGIALLERIRETYPELPFVLFPRDGDETVASEATAGGVTDYLPNSGEREQYQELGERVLGAVETDGRAEDQPPIAGTGYWEFECQQGTVEWSEGMYDLCDTPASLSPTLETTIEYYHQEDRATVRETIDSVIGTGDPETLEVRLKPDTVTTRWIRSRVVPLRGDGGIERVRVTAVNVTEYKTSIQELEHERDRYASLFRNLPNPAMYGVADSETEDPVVLEANAAFEETFGFEEETVVGEPIDSLIVPEDFEEEAQALNRRIIEQGEFRTEVKRRTADGLRTFRLDITVHDPDGEVIEGYALYTDVTEQRRYEKRLERTNERLDQFRSMISHDLRNPLTVAQLRLNLVTEECESEHLQAVDDALHRMEAMLNSMLLIARADAVAEDREPVGLGEIAARAWQYVPESGGTFRSEIPDGFTVECKPELLEQILENLFENAVAHGSARDEEITVTVGTVESDAERGFFVADDGTGIPPDEREQLFEQGHTTSEDGSGFGLAIVRELVEAHGWSIAVGESSDGGARFDVSFNRADPDTDRNTEG